MKFAEALKKWRGKTPAHVAAEFLGVPVRTFENWEQGREPDQFKKHAVLSIVAKTTLPK